MNISLIKHFLIIILSQQLINADLFLDNSLLVLIGLILGFSFLGFFLLIAFFVLTFFGLLYFLLLLLLNNNIIILTSSISFCLFILTSALKLIDDFPWTLVFKQTNLMLVLQFPNSLCHILIVFLVLFVFEQHVQQFQ